MGFESELKKIKPVIILIFNFNDKLIGSFTHYYTIYIYSTDSSS
jgi:hypothetical protein